MSDNTRGYSGKLRLSFGVITDTHIRAPEGDQSSPFPVNDLANGRAVHASKLLGEQQTLFNVHLGDMVHPLPGMPAYDSACETALEIFDPLQPELYFVPGNHDIGDKPMPGLPAAAVNRNALDSYHKYFGHDYYSFNKQNFLFVILNSSLLNCKNEFADSQMAWLEETLKANKDSRIFIFLHYPLFIHAATEAEHYDNIAEPDRSRLIGLIDEYQIELVLSGHVHHHFYNRLNHCKCYTLPPTSFTRQDYAEMFRVGPTLEYGRDDKSKYSVAVIDVYEHGHQLRLIPTHGKSDSEIPDIKNSAQMGDLKKAEIKITVPLRHAWFESIDLPCNGPMEEFSRKRVRNDYVFMRLQQMNIRDVRIPIDDIIDQQSLARVQDYLAEGFRFHAFCMQHLLQSKLALAGNSIELLSSLECVTDVAAGDIREPDFSTLVQKNVMADLRIGHALTGAGSSHSGKPFAHSVSSGFRWSDHKAVLELMGSWKIQPKSIVFQVPWETDQAAVLVEMQRVFSTTQYRCIANIRLANSNPAEENFDDVAICSTLQSVMQCAATLGDVDIQLDTSMDIDRGYSPRHGLLDRRCNLRPAGLWLSE